MGQPREKRVVGYLYISKANDSRDLPPSINVGKLPLHAGNTWPRSESDALSFVFDHHGAGRYSLIAQPKRYFKNAWQGWLQQRKNEPGTVIEFAADKVNQLDRYTNLEQETWPEGNRNVRVEAPRRTIPKRYRAKKDKRRDGNFTRR